MNSIISQLIIIQVGIPLALILLHTLVIPASLMSLVLRSAGLSLLVAYTAMSGVWLFPPWWTPYCVGFFLFIACVIAYRRFKQRHNKPRGVVRIADTIVGVIVTCAAFYLLLPAIQGRDTPDQTVTLANPLESGRYLVVSGGATRAINNHLMTLSDERFAAYRGQSYALDIVSIDEFGFRVSGISPKDPTEYHIYGKRVVSPCEGSVVAKLDGVADMQVPEMDRTHMLGNYIMLSCKGVIVVLAHLSPGSVVVKLGDQVEVGHFLGEVGNSGNTADPHLHIHVQKSLPEQHPVSGDPVWFTINNKFLVRNDRLLIP